MMDRVPFSRSAMSTDPVPRATPFHLLFVCTGNTCRSPLAEAIARNELAHRGWHGVDVRSAGVAAREGSPASAQALEVARRHGLQLEGHRTQPLSRALLEWADVVLTMGPSHLDAARRGGAADKAFLLTEFVGVDAPDGVLDPFGGPVEAYEETHDELRELIAAALDRMAPLLRS